jgi:hypothetical protein
MKSSALVAGLALLALVLPCSAQEVVPPSLPADSPPSADPRNVEVKNLDMAPPSMPAMVLDDNVLVGIPVLPPEFPHVWLEVNGILWWLRPNFVNVPLVTTTRSLEDLATSFSSGGVNDPNAAVLFGNQNFRQDVTVGGQVRFGAALDAEATEAFEASGFYLPWQVERANFVSSNANGNPALALPYNSVLPSAPGETSGVVAGLFNGTFLHGSVLIDNGTTMWGAEANYTKMLCSSRWGEFDGIVGVRYLRLEDYLDIDAETNATDGGGSTHDRFETRNSFYGGQIGIRHVLDFENWRIETCAKVAVGDTNEVLDISGSSTLPASVAGAAGHQLPGGFYTASSNIGQTSANRCGVVNEDTFNVSYKLSDHVQFTAGYTFLYWDRVLRSGDQIDHNLNPSLNPAFAPTVTTPGGPANPQRLNTESTFWAQGINFGVRFAF